MRWLKNLFGSKQPDTAIEASVQAVLPFLRSAHEHVDQRYFMTPRHHTLIYCFAYGALGVEATEHGMDESHQLAALLLILNTLSELSAHDTSALLGRCMTVLAEEEGSGFCHKGAMAYHSWRLADPAAVSILAENLQELR